MTRRLLALPHAIALLVATSSGCILEDNPAFVDGSTDGGSESTTFTTLGTTTASTTSASTTDSTTTDSTTTASTTDPTTQTGGETEGTTGGVTPSEGCDEVDCPEIHVGPVDDVCPHDENGTQVDTCDYVGLWAVRAAMGEADFLGGARVYLHDNNGIPATFLAGLEVPGHTSLLGSNDTPFDNLRLVWSGSPTGVDTNVRLRGDDVHLRGFTLVTLAGGQHAITWRADDEVPGTSTRDHLIENLQIISSTPEDVGANSTVEVFRDIGENTTIRNCRVWGFYEGTISLVYARGLQFYNNTLAYYQPPASSIFDAASSADVVIANNVLLNLSSTLTSFVQAADTTQNLTVVGNVIETATNAVAGAQVGAVDIVVQNNTLGEAPLESPHFPYVLSDATITADTSVESGGESLDGVDLEDASEWLPGAYQVRSGLSGPRRMLVTVGTGTCGATPCDIDPTAQNATQIAVWSSWPGGTVELHPGLHGGAEIGWPVNLRGTAYDQVTLERRVEGFLADHAFYANHNAIIKLTDMNGSSTISDLTLSIGPDGVGLSVEGSGSSAPPTPHVFERLRAVDEGDTDNDLATVAFWLGDNNILRDSLVIGGFQVCVRHGVRNSSSNATPQTRNWVYNVTCRQQKTVGGQPLAAFEVASVNGSDYFNIAVELAEVAPLFRAQRRSSSDTGVIALDEPTAFQATAWVVLNPGPDYDGFTDAEGTYVLTDVDEVLAIDPFFVSAIDSHLDIGAAGLDSGVDPVSIDSMLTPGTDFDGVSRATALAIDRGAYEQGT